MMPQLRANHLLFAATALLAALSVWPWLPSAASPATAEPEIAAPPSLPEIPPLSHFAAISERPAVSAVTQRPRRSGRPRSRRWASSRYRVVGLIIAGPSRRALLMSADRKLEVGEGDNLDGWRVERIEADRLVLSSAAGQAVLVLRDPAGDTPAGKPAQ